MSPQQREEKYQKHDRGKPVELGGVSIVKEEEEGDTSVSQPEPSVDQGRSGAASWTDPFTSKSPQPLQGYGVHQLEVTSI